MQPISALISKSSFVVVLACLQLALHAQPPAKKKAAPPQPQSREKRLIEAIDNKDLARVKALLEAGVKPDIKDSEGFTALTCAASVGSIPICETLVRKGAAIDGADKHTSNPLVVAILEKHADVVDWLLAHGAHADTTGYSNYSALDSAASTGQINLMKVLLDKGVPIGPSNDRKSLPLGAAAGSGQLAAIEFLLAHGAKLDDSYYDGETALMVASIESQPKAVNLLLAKGARFDLTDEKDDSALDLAKGAKGATKDLIIASLKKAGAKEPVPNLFRAVKKKDTVMLRSLLDKGADPNVQDAAGKTPLFYTYSELDASMLKTLIGKGANPNIKDKLGETVISLAKKDRDNDAIKELINAAALDPETDLVNAVLDNNEVESEKLLDSKVSPNAINTNGVSALEVACSANNEAMVRLLLSRGADINSANTNEITVLQYAALQGNVAMVRLLLDSGADIKAPTMFGSGILSMVGPEHQFETVQLLVERGAAVRARNKSGRCVLAILAGQSNSQTFQYLLDHGALADVNAIDEDDNTPLQDAAGALNKETVKLLLEHGANPNIVSKFSGETPIFYALVTMMRLDKGLDHVSDGVEEGVATAFAKIGKTDAPKPLEQRGLQERLKDGLAVVQLLASQGARLNIQDKSGKTPMQLALEWNSKKDIEALLSVGVRIPTSRAMPRTLADAVDGDDLSGVRQLIKKGANPNTPDKDNFTPLMTAAIRGDLEIVTYLLDHGARPDYRVLVRGYLPATPLFLAADEGHNTIIKLLLKRGANPKLPTGDNNSPLCRAAQEGHIESIRILLDAGVDVNAGEKTGITALMSALIVFARYDVTKFLLGRGARVVGKFVRGITPLMYAAEAGSADVVEQLITAGSDLIVRSESGETVLQYAVLGGDLNTVRKIVDALLRAKGNINDRNKDKKTALTYALDKHSDEIVDLLKKAGAIE